MPHRLSDQELEAGFIVRNDIFESIIGKLKSETVTSIPQHYLIVGQRGMGKTTLLLRTALELRRNDIYKHLIPLSFPEEQYNIDRLSKFWLNCLDALADALETENNKPLANEIDEIVNKLSKEADEKELADKSFEAFQMMTKKTRRRPVLLIDNLSQLLDSLQEKEQWELRNRITKQGSPILVGASAEPLKENYTYDAPFYDSFEVFLLEKLRFDETIFLLQSLAARTGEKELLDRLHIETARLKTLYTLTGGNPRTIVILFQVFAKGFSDTVYEDLDTLLEAVTPIYKARFEELSPQLQVVVDAIALHWDPCRLEELRELTRLGNSQLSAQLKRLKEIGWISQMEAFTGRGTAYEISERFFNVWYLMRRSSRRQRRDLLCLTRFLESLYAEYIDKVAECYLNDPVKDVQHVTYGLALANATKQGKLSNKIRDKAYDNLIEQEVNSDIIHAFELPEEYKGAKEKQLEVKVLEELKNKNASGALEVLKKWKKINPVNASVWVYEGWINASFLEKYTESKEALLKGIEIDENDSRIWNNLGIVLDKGFGDYEGAEKAFRKAIKVDEKDEVAWFNLGNLLQYNLKKYKDSEIAYREAIRLNKKDDNAWYYLAQLLQYDLKKYKDSEIAYREGIKLNKKNDEAWYHLGLLLHYNLNKHSKAEAAYRAALKLNKENGLAWFQLGCLLQIEFKRYVEAETAYQRAIEQDKNHYGVWNNLGVVLDEVGKYEQAEIAYRNAIELVKDESGVWNNLGALLMNMARGDEAEAAFYKAIELNETQPGAWSNLANLYYRLGRYKESEAAYYKALELKDNDVQLWNSFAILLKNHLNKFHESEQALLKAIALSPQDTNLYNLLGNLHLDHLHDYEKAMSYFKKALEFDRESIIPQYNLLFLLRDKLNKINEAEEIWKELKVWRTEELRDSFYLNEALFAFYEKNAGLAADYLKQALNIIGENLPEGTIDDWQRSAAITVKLGYGETLLQILKGSGHDVTFRPFYEAIQAFTLGTENYLNSVAAEIREPARQIYQYMNDYAYK